MLVRCRNGEKEKNLCSALRVVGSLNQKECDKQFIFI
jgi:hypothetical protein